MRPLWPTNPPASCLPLLVSCRLSAGHPGRAVAPARPLCDNPGMTTIMTTLRSPRSRRVRAYTTAALVFVLAVHASTPARAWGPLGHRVIARLAEKHLTQKAKSAVGALLEPGESIADASLWADDNQDQFPKTAPWHYVDVPLDEPRYDSRFSGDDPKKGCVVDKINEFRKVLGDKNKPIAERRFALRFLLHFVQDLHQPCHVGDNHVRGRK